MNPMQPKLLATIEAGVTPEEIDETYAEGLALGKSNPWAWALTTAANRHAEPMPAAGRASARASPGRPKLVTADFSDATYTGTPADELPPELR